MASKLSILDEMHDEFDRWEELLADLDQQEITERRLPAGLSVKDVVAHLMWWQKLSVARLEAGLEGRVPRFPAWPPGLDPEADDDLDQINAWIHSQYRDQPWSAVYQAWRAGFLRLMELGQAIPEADLMTPGRYAWMDGEPLYIVLTASWEHHHVEHLLPLVDWLREHDPRTEAGE